MTTSRFAEVYGGAGRVSVPDSPEIQVLEALADGEAEKVLSFFEEEKQFGGRSAVDTAHGRYEGLAGIRSVVEEGPKAFSEEGEKITGMGVEIVTQTRAGTRSALEFVFHFMTEDGKEKMIPMAGVCDLRDGLTKIDELRLYVHPRFVKGYPMYRHPIFPESNGTYEIRTEMTSGVMPKYFKTVHEIGMAHIPDMMTRTEDVTFGAYNPADEIRVVKQEDFQKMLAAQAAAREEKKAKDEFDPTSFALEKYVKLRMETIIDDGKICCVEWEQLVTKAGREERYRLSEPGISFYERAKDGWLKSVRIIDYAYTERDINWEKTATPKEEAERINYLG